MSDFIRHLFASSPIVIYTCKAGDDFGATFISENVTDYLGYAPDEFLNDTGFWKAHIHPEDRDRILTGLETLAIDRHHIHEYRFQAKNGEYRWLRDELRLIRNETTGVDELTGSLLDITDRKELEEKYRRIAGFTSNYVHCCTRKGMEPFRIQWIDGAVESITGYTREEILAMGCWQHLVHPDDRQAVSSHLSSLVPGDRKRIEFRVVTKEQETRWVVEKGLCEAGQSAGELLLFGAISDITPRKQAEENLRALNRDLQQRTAALEDANRELEAFSYTLSHDLRSYLARITLASEYLQVFEGERLADESKYFLETILETCQGMDGLIATMLDLAQISRQELTPQEINFSALAEQVCSELAEAEPDRTLRFEIARGLQVTGDADLLRVALENLLGNACKYTRDKQEARISLQPMQQGGRLVFAVADNGTGFDMAEAEKLFRPFKRLSNARSFPGFGIGLTTVQRIVSRHGGEIWAEAAPGDGATFFFTLPSGNCSENATRCV